MESALFCIDRPFGPAVSSSVKPACATVGSETASVSGAAAFASATESTQVSSAWNGA